MASSSRTFFILVRQMVLQFVILLSILCVSSVTNTCPNLNAERNSFSINSDVIHEHYLTNSTFLITKTINEVECFKECLQNCSCLSMNYLKGEREKNCQLNNSTEKMNPELVQPKPSWKYYHFVRENVGSSKTDCLNTCCTNNPCLHGGMCSELCANQRRRFHCTCKHRYSGPRCEIYEPPRSCADLKEDGISDNGWYEIYPVDKKPNVSVYCDFRSRDNLTWTLVMSYNYSESYFIYVSACKSSRYTTTSFSRYLLHLSEKTALRNRSSHWRATCEYDKRHEVLENYIVAKFDQIDLTAVWTTPLCRCRRFEEINVLETKCRNCTATVRVICPFTHFTVLGNGNSIPRCPSKIPLNTTYFGSKYMFLPPNPPFPCNRYPNSTTQYWFGSV